MAELPLVGKAGQTKDVVAMYTRLDVDLYRPFPNSIINAAAGHQKTTTLAVHGIFSSGAFAPKRAGMRVTT
jgi:hypothetical protein